MRVNNASSESREVEKRVPPGSIHEWCMSNVSGKLLLFLHFFIFESTMPVVSQEKWRRGSLQAPYMNGVCRMSRVNFCFSFISSSSVEESSLHCHLEGWHAAMSGKARKMFLYIIEHINPGGQTKCFIFLWETFKEIPPNKSFRLEGTTFT